MFIFFLSGTVLVTYYAWEHFKLMFEPSPVIWLFTEQIPKSPTAVLQNKISLTIKFPEQITVGNKTAYPIVVHGNVTVGFLFYYFLRVQYNYGLMVTDELAEKERAWLFYLLNRSGNRKKLVNPELTIKENGIKENGVIEAIRITRIPVLQK